jgi:hypothetical protein
MHCWRGFTRATNFTVGGGHMDILRALTFKKTATGMPRSDSMFGATGGGDWSCWVLNDAVQQVS